MLFPYTFIAEHAEKLYDHENDTRPSEVDPFVIAKPYRVAYYSGRNRDFATFIEALSFYETAQLPRQLVNLERYDGAPDAACERGLTESEQEMVEMVDWPPGEPCVLTDGDPGGCDPEPREYR
jgi:hypothetical protein